MSASDPNDDHFEGKAGDGEDLAPDVEVPTPSPGESDVDPDLRRLFWRLVVLCNVALFGVTVGPMVLYFEGDTGLGVGLFVVGAVAGAVAGLRYWRFRRE